MIKILYLFLISIIFSSCSLNKNSKFWTKSKIVEEDINSNIKELFVENKAINKELNTNITVRFQTKPIKNSFKKNYNNNNGRIDFDSNLKNISKYKFSKIEKFHQYEPTISFYKKNIIFFDNKGTILQFDKDSKLIWKKNFYSKLEKKLNPILQFANDGKSLIVADNIAKYYKIDLDSGNLIWSKTNIAPFNSQIKIYKDKFFIIDLSNTLRCFSLKDGKELWSVVTENSLIRSQKKLSLIIVDEKIYFNNSIGDISAVDINTGNLIWQLPTQSSLIYESAFSLETSDIIADAKNIYFSNNKNQFFSLNMNTGSFNWKNNINSSLRPSLIEDYLFSISLEGYLMIIEKETGNIIRVTDVFDYLKPKLRDKIKPVGFIVGSKNIYLSTSHGRLLIIDIAKGKTISSLKIDNEKISRPFISNENLFVIKDNSINKLN